MKKKGRKIRQWMASFLVVAMIAGNTGLSAVPVGADDLDVNGVETTAEALVGNPADTSEVSAQENAAEQPVVQEAAQNEDAAAVASPEEQTGDNAAAAAQEASVQVSEAPAAKEAVKKQEDTATAAQAEVKQEVTAVPDTSAAAEEKKAEPAPEKADEAAKAEENAQPAASEAPAADDAVSDTASTEEASEQKLNFPTTEQTFSAAAAGYTIAVKVPANSFEENVTLKANAQTWEQLTGDVRGQLEKNGVDKTHSQSIDLRFENVAGQELEPANAVSVNFTIKDAKALEGASDKESKLDVYHAEEKADGSTNVRQVATKANNSVRVQSEKQAVAEFKTESFSTFTITWRARDGYSSKNRAILTLQYVNNDGKELNRNQTRVLIDNNNDTTHLATYGVNDINNYRYYDSYIVVEEKKQIITDITYKRQQAGGYYTYTVSYLNDGELVTEDTTNSTDGTITRNIYMEYYSIHSGDHDASVYFLLTPTSNADSNDVDQWNSNEVAIGLGDAKVNLEGATFADGNKNIFRNRDGNGDLSRFIISWPNGATGATWTINTENTNGQWGAITTSVANAYQNQLKQQLGSNATVKPSDIESITVTPHKISVNNGNVKHESGEGETEVIHIDCTISVVCRTAYHYAFIVDFPENSGYTDQSVKEGNKAIRVSQSSSTPEPIGKSDMPGTTEVPQTITNRNGIEYTFDGWYRKADYTGKRAEFAYFPAAQEVKDNHGTINFYARYVQSTRNIRVTKRWNDQDNQDGKRPTGVTIKLLADGHDTEKTLSIAAGDDWTGTFTGLPILNNDGREINYTVREVPVKGYTSSEPAGNATQGFTITNKHNTEKVRISGTKIWEDNHNQDGKRPNAVTVRLHADGKALNDKVCQVSGGTTTDKWTYTFDDLPKYANGEEIEYTVTEDRVENYSSSVNNSTFTITNSYTPSKTSVNVTKHWVDNNNQDNLRPEAVTVKLLADGRDTGKTVSLSAGNEWTGNFSNLDEYNNGEKIAYTVKESDVPAGYSTNVSGDATKGFVIANTHTPETIDISVNKIWNDNNNQDGKRPAEVTVRLHANGREVQSHQINGDQDKDTWSYEFKNLPKFSEGKEITYSVTEDAVDNYSAEIDHFTITNSYTPQKTSVNVVKEWDDHNNQDGIRPERVVVRLYANGDKTGNTVTLSAQNQWQDTFTDLDMYQNGQSIIYTVREEDTTEGYEAAYSGNTEEGLKITNIHRPETITISGKKIWDDHDNQAKNRPESVTIRLYANGEPLQNQVDTVKGGTDQNTWTYSFENLPKYENGRQIIYTVTEDHVENYTPSINHDTFEIINNYTPSKTSVTVTKDWEDNDNQDGIRPKQVTVKLLADGKETEETISLNAENEWTAIFDNLEEYRDGKKIVYTVKESDVPEGYTSAVSGDTTSSFVIANAHTPETVRISGTKTWKGDSEGNRPESITIRLHANGEEKDAVTVKKADDWKYSFTNLPKFENGKAIVYTITEDQVENYTAAVVGYDVTNTYTPNKTDVMVTKAWHDSWKDIDDYDGIRPDSITIKLLADGKDTGKSVTLNKDNKWTGEFTGLMEKDADGKEIKYTVEEVKVDGYSVDINGSAKAGYTITNTHVVDPNKGEPGDNTPDGGKPSDDNGGSDPSGPKDDPGKDMPKDDNKDNKPIVTPDDQKKHTIRYTDGVDGEEIFEDQVYEAEVGEKTPAFKGVPTRKGYVFKGWSPVVSDKVTGDATYKAIWEKIPVSGSNSGRPSTSPIANYIYNGRSTGGTGSSSFSTKLADAVKTADSNDLLLYFTVMLGAAAVLAGLVWGSKKREQQKKNR